MGDVPKKLAAAAGLMSHATTWLLLHPITTVSLVCWRALLLVQSRERGCRLLAALLAAMTVPRPGWSRHAWHQPEGQFFPSQQATRLCNNYIFWQASPCSPASCKATAAVAVAVFFLSPIMRLPFFGRAVYSPDSFPFKPRHAFRVSC